jgi:ribose transport system permease protein
MPIESFSIGRIFRPLMPRDAGVLPILFVALVVLLSATQPYFLHGENIINVLRDSSFLVIVSAGQMLVLIVGGFDLSVGAVIALSSVISATVMADFPKSFAADPVLIASAGMLAGLACGVVVGLVNAACVALLRIPPFMATLATMSLADGASLLLTNGIPVYGMPAGYVQSIGRAIILGLPVALYFAAAIVLVLWFVLNMTWIGRYIYATGGNLQAATVSGVNTRLILMLAYVLSSFLAALTGLLLTAEIGSGQATTGENLMLESIAAAVLAGVSLRGGVGRIELVALGAVFLLTLTNAMDLMRVDTRYQLIILGIVLAISISIETIARREPARV